MTCVRFGWQAVVLAGVAVMAGCASSGGSGSSGPGDGGSAGEGATDAPATASRWPSPASYDYRPETPDIEAEAKGDKPPPWFMALVLLGDVNARESVASVDQKWAAEGNRVWLLRQKLSQAKDRWAWERENKKPVVVPRDITADLQADAPPAWARSVPGAFIDSSAWARGSEEVRRRELEPVALQEARYAYQNLSNEYAIHKANQERLAKIDADQKRQREQQETARQREQEDREARAKYERLRDEKIGQAEAQPVAVQDLLNAPMEFKGRTVKVRGHWHESVGRGMHLDALGGAPVLIVGVTPPERREPQVMLALDFKDYQARIEFYSGLAPKTALERGASVELTVFVLGSALDAQLPCVGRILAVRVE